MRVTNPQESFQGYQPEDVFVAVNDYGVQCGHGYVVYQNQPAIYPDRPVNIFFTMECTPDAEYLLFGALVARARQLRMIDPRVGARMYTSVNPGDSRLMNFYLHNDMKIVNTEDVMRMRIPQDAGGEIFNFSIIPMTYNTIQDQTALVGRLQRNSVEFISLQYLQLLMTNPSFHACGLLCGQNLIGECITVDRGGYAEVAAIYVAPEFQRRGLGKRLLHRALFIAGQEGAAEARIRIMSASIPQTHLVRAFGGELLEQTMLYPGYNL